LIYKGNLFWPGLCLVGLAYFRFGCVVFLTEGIEHVKTSHAAADHLHAAAAEED
jgi:hypothetical protein